MTNEPLSNHNYHDPIRLDTVCNTFEEPILWYLERRPPLQEAGSSIPGRVKLMTYKSDTCHFLAWNSTESDNVTECCPPVGDQPT